VSCRVVFKPFRTKSAVPVLVALILGTIAAIDLSLVLSGCREPNSQDAAKAAFAAELAACVDYSQTVAEGDACFAEVSKRWGFCKTDAGKLETCK